MRECWCAFGNQEETWYVAVYAGCEHDETSAGYIMADVCDDHLNFTDGYGAEDVWELIPKEGQDLGSFADIAAEVSVDFQYRDMEERAERSWFETEPDW